MFRICWHDWSGWSIPVDTDYPNKKDQFRVCLKCSKTASRTFNHTFAITAEKINEVMGDL